MNDGEHASDGAYVLYWMVAARRRASNFGLQRAAEWAARLDRPLLILEALRVEYPHASERLHRFIVDGMIDNVVAFDDGRATYYPYLERSAGDGSGLVETLAREACVIVTDDFPAFFLPRMLGAAASRVGVRFESVDSNGLLPIRESDRVWKTAYSFRRHVQKHLPAELERRPAADPLASLRTRETVQLPHAVRERWPDARPLLADDDPLEGLALDREVPAAPLTGGPAAAERELATFVDRVLASYGEERNHPDEGATSGLSPYLHFGHLSSDTVFDAIADAEDWSPDRLGEEARGKRSGWWGMSESAEGFLDQIITWRELGYRCAAAIGPDYATFDSVPEWAQETLAEHEDDPRPHLYSVEELERAETEDEIWNAAQTQLVREGRIHNYLRMLWGKRVLEWTRSPREAFDRMVYLNDRWALDGRDPNSYTGIGWVLGRHDRPWGPERPIFGKVRYMSSANTRRKLRLREYLEEFRPENRS